VLGVVYDFTREELFSGVVGDGAFLNEAPIRVSKTTAPGEAIAFTGFPSAASFETDSLTSFVEMLQRFKKVRLLGSAALSLAYVACGRGDVYIEQRIRIWDIAAGVALVNAAGGAFQTLGTDPLDVYADNGVLIGVPQ
jgi:myo-inositol-1(or 4)-monophosphatase